MYRIADAVRHFHYLNQGGVTKDVRVFLQCMNEMDIDFENYFYKHLNRLAGDGLFNVHRMLLLADRITLHISLELMRFSDTTTVWRHSVMMTVAKQVISLLRGKPSLGDMIDGLSKAYSTLLEL